jgi:DNA-binding transcriptional LysR family regulator
MRRLRDDGVAKSQDDDVDPYRVDAQLLSDLWIFRAAARFGSITAAANRLRVTQGAVSQRVIRLEGRLGAPLFLRKSGRLSLTEAGEAVAGAMNDVAVRLNGVLSRFDQVQRASLVLSCLPSLATEWLVPRLDGFYQQHPDIELFIRAESTQATLEYLEDNSIDVFIGYQQSAAKDLHELAALQELTIPVCSRAYRDAMEGQDGQLTLTRLHDDAPWDDRPWKGGTQHLEWDAWEAARPDWHARAVADRHFNLSHLAYHAALCGQGVAIGRAVLVNRLIGRGELIAASDLPPTPGASYRVMTARPGDGRSAVRKFAQWIIQAMEQTQQETLAMVREVG